MGTNIKYAADFRRDARNALRGKWVLAVLVGLAAYLLGGALADSNGPEVKLNFDGAGIYPSLQVAGRTVYALGRGMSPGLKAFLVGSAVYLVAICLLLAALYYVLGSVIRVGYARFNLGLLDREKTEFETLFAYFPNWKTTAVSQLLRDVYILLWSLLLVIPGIMASYSYAMTDYILAENPELTAGEAISRSKAMMAGNRWRLFCLHVSFIGWMILSALTLGIGDLFLRPYREAAAAAFYREVSGTARTPEPQV